MTITGELVIVRHGEAACNVAGRVGGDLGCTGLTEAGREQARRVGRRLAAEHARRPFDVFQAAPRLRVRQTADEIAAWIGLTPTVRTDLRGPDHGECDGQPWHEVHEALGGNPRRFPERAYAPGSESWNQYLRRACAGIGRLLEHHAGQRVLLVGHKETVEAAHALLLGLRRGSSRRLGFIVGHACLARWVHRVDGYGHAVWELDSHNDGRHLAEPAAG